MKDYAPLGMAFLMISSILVAAYVVNSFKENGLQAFENPNDITNIIQIFSAIIIFTIIILLVAKYGEWAIKYIVLSVFFLASISIFDAFFYFTSYSFIIALAISTIMIILLFKHPEWYIIDLFGVFIGGGIAAIFAISLSNWLIILLLLLLAIYDFISVHKTKHMINLAKSITSSNLPLLMVFPKNKNYSYISSHEVDKEEKDAVYMGLGDIIVPSILASYAYTESITSFFLTLAGIILGYIFLMKMIKRGPQPGLPYLNGGAIIGYLIYHIYPHFLQ